MKFTTRVEFGGSQNSKDHASLEKALKAWKQNTAKLLPFGGSRSILRCNETGSEISWTEADDESTEIKMMASTGWFGALIETTQTIGSKQIQRRLKHTLKTFSH
jgi:hypothetical protein